MPCCWAGVVCIPIRSDTLVTGMPPPPIAIIFSPDLRMYSLFVSNAEIDLHLNCCHSCNQSPVSVNPFQFGCTSTHTAKISNCSLVQVLGWIGRLWKTWLKFGELRYFALGWFVRIVFLGEWDEADAFSAQNIF